MVRTKVSSEQLRAGLAAYTGTERWFRHWTRHFLYTEGIDYLAETAHAHWLIDLIASWCCDPRIHAQEFVTWKPTVHANRSTTAVATDGNDHELVRQDIGWTDFPLDEITLYLTNDTLLLPSEY
ncbi:MAG: DUF6876 family protein [Acetobacteraceae bacterium]